MSAVEIVPLRCPSCGNTSNIPEKELRFGYQFTCPHCGTVSVLIINRMLYIPSPGEKVCIECGRVAHRDARFCQCGALLVRTCINPECLKEFPVHHNICDYCGWPQEVEFSSEAGIKLRIKRAIRDLSSPDPKIQMKACEALKAIGPAASDAIPALANFIRRSKDLTIISEAYKALGKIGPAAVKTLADLIKRSRNWDEIKSACDALLAIGPAAFEAIPALNSLLGWSSPLNREQKDYVRGIIEEIEKKRREEQAGCVQGAIILMLILALVVCLVSRGKSSSVPTTLQPLPQTPHTATPTPQLPKRACPSPEVCITYPPMNATLRGVVQFRGTATCPNFDYYKFEFKPEGAKNWNFLVRFNKPVVDGILMEWHTTTVPPGVYWLRLIMVDKSGNYWPEFAELRVIVAEQR